MGLLPSPGRLLLSPISLFEQLANVKAIEKSDDMIQFEKIDKQLRIDLFDASVFACVRYLNDLEKPDLASSWFGGKK